MIALSSYVLIVDTDDDLRCVLVDLFDGQGFEVKQECESSPAVAHVMNKDPAVILMVEDMLPVEDVELLPLLRRLSDSIIVVMGDGREISVVASLLQGADVYIRKPVNYRELLTRVRALLRRSKFSSSSHGYVESNKTPD